MTQVATDGMGLIFANPGGQIVTGDPVDCECCDAVDTVACCFPPDICNDLTLDECIAAGGQPQPGGSTCNDPFICEAGKAMSCPVLPGNCGQNLIVSGSFTAERLSGPMIGCPVAFDFIQNKGSDFAFDGLVWFGLLQNTIMAGQGWTNFFGGGAGQIRCFNNPACPFPVDCCGSCPPDFACGPCDGGHWRLNMSIYNCIDSVGPGIVDCIEAGCDSEGLISMTMVLANTGCPFGDYVACAPCDTGPAWRILSGSATVSLAP